MSPSPDPCSFLLILLACVADSFGAPYIHSLITPDRGSKFEGVLQVDARRQKKKKKKKREEEEERTKSKTPDGASNWKHVLSSLEK